MSAPVPVLERKLNDPPAWEESEGEPDADQNQPESILSIAGVPNLFPTLCSGSGVEEGQGLGPVEPHLRAHPPAPVSLSSRASLEPRDETEVGGGGLS